MNVNEEKPKRVRRMSERLNIKRELLIRANRSIEHLPPEMLMEIFKHVDIRGLFQSRLVNRKWNHISSTILLHRSKQQVSFTFLPEFNLYQKIPLSDYPDSDNDCLPSRRKTLQNFVKLCQQSQSFPFTRFSFEQFDHRPSDMNSFLTEWGHRIVYVEINPPTNEESLESLRLLLTKFCVNLQELAITEPIDGIGEEENESVELFPDNNDRNEPNTNNSSSNNNSEIKLPRLKILRVGYQYLKYRDIVSDILRVAVNLEAVKGPWENKGGDVVEGIKFLSDHGKLHLIKDCKIFLSNYALMEHWNKFPGEMLKLRKLKLRFALSPLVTNSNQAKYCNQILTHTKPTLEKLSFGSFPTNEDVDWSLFENLRRLSIIAKKNPRLFFPGVSSQHKILPNLFRLKLKCYVNDGIQPPEFLPVLPSVRILDIKRSSFDTPFLRDLSIMFPNVSSLVLSTIQDFQEVGRFLFVEMKQLISLTVELTTFSNVYVEGDQNVNLFPAVDSCLTGLSEQVCRDLFDKYGKKDKNYNVQESVLKKLHRDSPSILNMTNLRRFEIRLRKYRHICGLSEMEKQRKMAREPVFQKTVSPVSHLFAFNLMPDLEVVIDRDYINYCV